MNKHAAMIDAHVELVYQFCARMTLKAAEAEALTFETFERACHGEAPEGPDVVLWLLKIADHVVTKRLPAAPDVSFDLLDDTLRSEATRTNEVPSLSVPERELMLWELKQGCMTAVVNCLSPAERSAFVLTAIMGRTEDDAATALGIRTSALKVRLSRARQKIADYLAPRCEHVDPRNPCHCPSRIGVALRKGFIAPPQTTVVQLRTRPFEQSQRSADAVDIFKSLPELTCSPLLIERLQTAAAGWPTKA